MHVNECECYDVYSISVDWWPNLFKALCANWCFTEHRVVYSGPYGYIQAKPNRSISTSHVHQWGSPVIYAVDAPNVVEEATHNRMALLNYPDCRRKPYGVCGYLK